MWDPPRGAFAAGTTDDGVTRNPLLALDAQIWPLLALPGAATRYGEVMTRGVMRLRAGGDAAAGFAYSEAGGGFWTEGTAQVGLLQPTGSQQRGIDPSCWRRSRRRVRPTGATTPRRQRLCRPGSCSIPIPHSRASTCISSISVRRRWVALAQQGFNPFTGTRRLPQQNRLERGVKHCNLSSAPTGWPAAQGGDPAAVRCQLVPARRTAECVRALSPARICPAHVSSTSTISPIPNLRCPTWRRRRPASSG